MKSWSCIMNDNIRMKNEKWDDHSSIVQLFKNLRLCNFLYVFPMETSKGILGRCGTPIYFADFFLLNHFFVHWEHDHGKWDQVALKKNPKNHLLARMVSLDEHLKKIIQKNHIMKKMVFRKQKLNLESIT